MGACCSGDTVGVASIGIIAAAPLAGGDVRLV